MLTLRYNEPVFTLTFRGGEGCLAAVYKESFIREVVCGRVCVCVILYTSQCNMASRKRKTMGFRTEELADAVNEIIND
jgi:hypothetical protein